MAAPPAERGGVRWPLENASERPWLFDCYAVLAAPPGLAIIPSIRSTSKGRGLLAACIPRGRAMGEYPFIKFFTSDFLAASAGLSAAETGIFIKLLCQFYEHDGPIKRDDARLARVCGCPKPAFRKALTALLESRTVTEEECWLFSPMAEKQIADRQVRTQKAAHAAQERWTAQGQKAQENQCPDHADASPEQCMDDASQKSRIQSLEIVVVVARPRTRPTTHLLLSILAQRRGQGSPRIKSNSSPPAAPIRSPAGSERPAARLGTPDQMIEAHRWLTDLGLTEDQVLEAVTGVVSQKRDGPPNTLKYFTPALERLAGDLTNATTKPMEAKHVDRPDHSRGRRYSVPARTTFKCNPESSRIADFARLRAARRDAQRGD